MDQYDALFEEAGRKHNVDPALLRAVAKQESDFQPDVTSPKGAGGLMQIMPRTAQKLGVDPYKPEEAIPGAAQLLSEALDRNGNVADAIAEYHGGPNRKLWGPKTRAYQEAVLAKYSGQQETPPTSAADAVLFGEGQPGAPPTKADSLLFGDQAPPNRAPSAAPDTAQMTDTGTGQVPYTKGPGTLDDPQTKLLQTFEKGGFIDRDAPVGSVRNPRWMTPDTSEKDVPPGEYYVTRGKDAMLLRAPGGENESAPVSGVMQGLGDVALTGANMLPRDWLEKNFNLRQRLVADQQAYNAAHGGDLVSGAGRFAGQVLGTAPLLAGGEAAVGAGLGESALGRLLLGKAGTAMEPGISKLAVRGSSLAAKGALEGSGAAGLVSSANDQPVSQQMAQGALGGAILGPALPAVSNAGQAAGEAARGALERWTYQGREKAIDRLLGQVAPSGFKLDTRELVPGSYPTMAEAAGEPGISALERNARTNPKLAQVFSDRLDQNAQARREFFERIAKDPEAITDAEAAREAATGKLRDQAFAGAKPADPSGVLAKIEETMKGPSGQRDVVVKALNNIKSKLSTESGPQTDVQQLYGIRKSIDDMLSPLGPSEAKGSQLATRELMDVKGELDKAIEQAAPGFKGYLKTYSDMSKPIDEMKLLQGLKLADQNGNITLAKVNNALDKIETKRKVGGTSKEKSVSDDTLSALKALRDDLARASNIMKGKAPGSDTAQNLTMQKFAEGGGVPLGVSATLGAKIPGAGLVLGAANKALSAQNEKMLQQLSSRLLQPEVAAPQVKLPARKIRLRIGDIAVPAIGGISAANATGG